jgi:hypothetical protein
MILLRTLELNSLIPHYWSELFLLAKQLLNEEEEKRLYRMVRELEQLVLEEEFWYNHLSCSKCQYSWKTDSDWFEFEVCPKCDSPDVRIVRERHSLYDIEMALESNKDFTAYFERYGIPISKFDVERRLNKIKEWIFMIVKRKASQRRFKRFR